MPLSLRPPPSPAAADAEPADLFDVDVLVIGASPAGVHAAWAAAAQGRRVLVVDRRPQPLPPAEAGPGAEATGAARTGSPSAGKARAPRDGSRARGVLWLAGHAALELLLDARGAVRGAAGVSPDAAGAGLERPWRATAGAVVLATRRGLLMAAEAGARLGGMDADGGLLVRDAAGATSVAGLFAAGRAAWREVDCGLPPHTAAGALLTGQRTGQAAAALSVRQATPPAVQALWPAGRVGLRGPGSQPISPAAAQAALQALQSQQAAQADLRDQPAPAITTLRRLDALWQFLRLAAPAPRGALRATRDAAARLAEARWQLRSRIARAQDLPAHAVIVTGGLDEVWAETTPGVWSPDIRTSERRSSAGRSPDDSRRPVRPLLPQRTHLPQPPCASSSS